MPRFTLEATLNCEDSVRQLSALELSRALIRLADDLAMRGFGERHGHLRDDRHNPIGHWRVDGVPPAGSESGS
jgi:hypothetical protein